MGFFKACIEVLLKLTPFYSVTDVKSSQEPLRLPIDKLPGTGNHVASHNGVQKPTITCSYPYLEAKGWVNCNTDETRDCWLLNPNLPPPFFTQYDIQTDCSSNPMFDHLRAMLTKPQTKIRHCSSPVYKERFVGGVAVDFFS